MTDSPTPAVRKALDALEVAADPALAADAAGLVWGDLEQEDRDLLASIHLAALDLAIERLGEAALNGDMEAALWIQKWRLPKRRRGPYGPRKTKKTAAC